MHNARTHRSHARLLLGAMLAGFAGSAFGQNLLMAERPVFENLGPSSGITPVEVDLANTGPDANGVVRVSCGAYVMNYPVELPQGTRKTLITYPDCSQFGGGEVAYDLLTDKGRLHQILPPNSMGGPSDYVIGEVCENGGDLSFIKQAFKQQDSSYNSMAPLDVYVKPEEAPDRPAGYRRLTALVLGDGAERLTDDAVNAIKTWALGGGTIVFIGGASSPVLNDARWAAFLPVQNARPTNLPGSKSLETLYGSSPAAFTAMIGDPAPGASVRAQKLIVEKPAGLGRSVYLAFNPFENPILRWDGRSKMFAQVLSPALMQGPQMAIQSVVGATGQERYFGRYSSTYYSGSSYRSASDRANNPFRTKLPQTLTVFLILSLYFVAVVPVNFFVLRKLKRGELAWATAPLLSLAFAAVFFEEAKGLYSAKLSTSTRGILVMQAGEPDALVIGDSQVFFPTGGNYDLQLKGIDSITDNTDPYSYGSQHSVYEDLDPSDTGEIRASIGVPNLAFREIGYRERAQANNWFSLRRLPNGRILISNRSPYRLQNARLIGGGGTMEAGLIGPNDEREVEFHPIDSGSGDFAGRLSLNLDRSHVLALTGRLPGFRAGPLVGSEVPDSYGVNVAYVSNEMVKNSEVVPHANGEAGPQ